MRASTTTLCKVAAATSALVVGTGLALTSAAPAQAAGTVADTGATFTQYPAPDSMPNAHGAGEPSIGTNWNSGATLYQSLLNTYKVTFDDSVSPAKATFADRSATAANGCLSGGVTSLDPILFTDHQTGRTFESQ